MSDKLYSCQCGSGTFYLSNANTVICTVCKKQQLGLVINYPSDLEEEEDVQQET